MTKEFRCIGPPGTGKTTWLARQVTKGARQYGSDNVLVASLTRTAAAEVAGRDLPLSRHQVGTLHSHAFRSIRGSGEALKIADSGEGIRIWNEWVAPRFPGWKLSESGKDTVDDTFTVDSVGETQGDKLFGASQVFRQQLAPQELRPSRVREFEAEWGRFKQETGMLDFTDLIEVAYQDVERAPGNPALMFVDEAQDHSRLELGLVRKWAEHTEQMVIVGDPDQNLYEWRGSEPEAFFNPPLPADRYRVLRQSYRVPRVPHRQAVAWIERTQGREPVEYHPRIDKAGTPVEGVARKSIGTFSQPDYLMADVDTQVRQGRSVMLLATCNYMLNPLLAALRNEGVPFHNPYRPAHGGWNPLRSYRERLLAFMRPDAQTWGADARLWNRAELVQWGEHLDRSAFHKGGKTVLKNWKEATEEFAAQVPEVSELLGIFTEEALGAAMRLDLDWWEASHIPSKRKAPAYPVAIAKRHGTKALIDPPKVTVGTVHSVKGGESDVVFVSPDLSRSGFETWLGRDRDRVRRTFYVAMTRAREELVLCSPGTRSAVWA